MDELNPDELNADERAMVELVRDFVNREVKPAVRELEHANTYPGTLIEQMKRLGIFGLAIPEPWGDAQVSASCYARTPGVDEDRQRQRCVSTRWGSART